MKLIMLGSGTSTGVPRVGNDWGLCDPHEPRNRRSRVSIIVESAAGRRLLVDTSTDLRSQLLANNIDHIDGVFWTHDHADHCHGIDDLRALRFGRSNPIPGFASVVCAQRLKRRFDYIFEGQFGYSTVVDLSNLDGVRMCAGFGVASVEMPHGPVFSTGYRFEEDGKSVVYLTDFSAITGDMRDLAHGADILVVDCLRREPHPTHCHLDMAVQFIEDCGARVGVLSHLDKSMDYHTVTRGLPGHIQVGYDGLSLIA